MDHPFLSVTPPLSRFSKFRRFVGRLFMATIAVVLVLAVDFSPKVADPKTPTAEQAQRVRRLASQLQSQLRQNDGLATLFVDRVDLASAATLVTALKKFGRVDGTVADKSATIRLSRRFGYLWVNGEARLSPSATGFPETRLKIGDLPIGPVLSRWIMDRTIGIARYRGVKVPPVDDLVRSLRIENDTVVLSVHLPLGGAFANDLSNFREQPVDAAQTAAIYCQLIAQNRKAPSNEMAILVHRAFAVEPSALPIIEQNRAALVALAMYTASVEAGRLAGDATQRVRKCTGRRGEVRLVGRADLASHWALSAAFAVSLGNDVGRAMGEWKELSDSRPGGSGFSFVDLAADRAGLAFARRATDPATAAATAKKLRIADGEYLLPVRALALSEGLSEREFITGFKTINSAQFAEAKVRIDAVIASTSAQKP
jgi:hypothetical protein